MADMWAEKLTDRSAGVSVQTGRRQDRYRLLKRFGMPHLSVTCSTEGKYGMDCQCPWGGFGIILRYDQVSLSVRGKDR